MVKGYKWNHIQETRKHIQNLVAPFGSHKAKKVRIDVHNSHQSKYSADVILHIKLYHPTCILHIS